MMQKVIRRCSSNNSVKKFKDYTVTWADKTVNRFVGKIRIPSTHSKTKKCKMCADGRKQMKYGQTGGMWVCVGQCYENFHS